MADLNSLADRLHYDGTREYTYKRGGVAYLDGSRLARPSSMPAAQRIIAAVIVVIAVAIGAFMVNDLVISKWQEAADAEQAVAEGLAREASLESLPSVANLINLDNDSIKASLEADGNTIYDASGVNEESDLVLYRIPADMTAAEAAALYARGIGSLNAAQAAQLLNGSWSFNADRVGGTSMIVRYADFTAGDPEIAVQHAVNNQGYDSASITNSGVDESGNTYSAGTIEVDGTSCTWKVSALPLSDVYDIAGLPEDACYVGIRVTVA